jgi:hypothetical protein
MIRHNEEAQEAADQREIHVSNSIDSAHSSDWEYGNSDGDM